jgi:hypothetical protein
LRRYNYTNRTGKNGNRLPFAAVMLVLTEGVVRCEKIKLMMEQARPSWQSYEQAIMTYPYKVHDDDQDDNSIDDDDDSDGLCTMVFSPVF